MLISKILLLIHSFIAITAIAGGYGLIFMTGLGAPVEFLKGSPFTNYVGPGLILAFIVGGTNLISAYLLIKKAKLTYMLSTISGFGMIIFEFFQIYIIRQPHWLQVFYFSLGILILVLNTYEKHKVK